MLMKNSNAVAAEKRVDLASLFCMISRHGPAVALALIAMVSVLAGFIIYRSVRGKRRKATAADGDSASPEEETDTSVIRPGPGPGPSSEESHSSAESTDASNEDLSDVREAPDSFQTDLKVRRRRAAAEKKPPPYSPHQSHIQIPDNKLTTSDNTEEMTPEQDSDKGAEASLNPQCDTGTAAEMEVECANDCHHSATADISQDVIEEICDNKSCLKETELVEVFKAGEQEGENVNENKTAVDKDRQAEENLKCTSNNQECFDQAPPALSENADDSLLDNETTPQTDSVQCSSVEPIINVDDPPVTVTCSGKDEDYVEENHLPDRSDYSNCLAGGVIEEDIEKDHLFMSVTSALDSDWLKREIQCKNYETGEFVVFPQESIELQKTNNESFATSSAAVGPDTTENLTAPVQDQQMPQLPSIHQDEKIYHMEIHETCDRKAIPATDAAVCHNHHIITPAVLEEVSYPDVLSFSQQSAQIQNDEDFLEFITSAAPVATDDLKPPMCQFHLSSLEQSELRDNNQDSIATPSVGEESGISSMAVSPDLHGAGDEFELAINNMMLPTMECDAPSEERTETQNSHVGRDVGGTVFRPYSPPVSQQPRNEHTDSAKNESFAANEDMFGHEIEDSYHRAWELVMVQDAASEMSLTKEPKEQIDVKTVVEVVEKKTKATVSKKAVTEGEKEKEEDYEKTNISIMEATMDNNEWITDSNNQVLPWMNFSLQPLAQEHPKMEKLPSEDSFQESSTLTDTPPSSAMVQNSTLSPVHTNTESNKKVVSVQPMPQNVNVTFRIHYITHTPYQTVAVTGNQQELGNWKEFIPLEKAGDGLWATVVSLPVDSLVEWKFVLMDKGEVFRWEECGNRLLDTGYGDDLIVQKWWGFM
ncbi:uncharacterized protein stbd1 [Echeneis naucrates]|uniref:Starch-binding domain-containing protein 1 n=1 Tax=Echeneis naucrates TaxID=173247 RepID=A0A665U6N2_ECHNA|nr:starch-binding domain-containing protein 1 [Echeneis naucrates]